MRSTIYAILAGIPLAALSMTWVEARYLYVILAVYAIVQMIIDIFTNKIEFKVFRTTSVIMLTGYLVSLPVIAAKQGGFSFDLTFFLCMGVVAFGAIYYFFGWKKLPWTISLPIIFSFAAIILLVLRFIDFIAERLSFLFPIKRLADILFGTGIYGNKVSMTIAEANTYQISHTVMSFGPALYWLGWAGFVLLLWYYYRNKFRREYLFIIVLFIVNLWLAGTAGRFLNDSVPLIAILGGWAVWFVISKIDYKQMIRNIKSAGGGFHGIRRGVKFLHIFGILFLSILVILPNAFVAFDAAVPNKAYPLNENRTEWSNWKVDYFGEDYSGAFGLGTGKESYWVDALTWLNEQDTEIESPYDRPAFISWWDYGFYEVAIGGHPTVADNFQDGIPPAANFHTATSEQEAVVVWIVRLLEGNREDNGGKLTDEVKDILAKYTGNESRNNITRWMEAPRSSPSYENPIGLEYDDELGYDYVVGQQYHENAVYHDIVDLLVKNENTSISDDEITWLYHEIQNATGYSIRYYGVEGYDRQIFNIFAFLSDKSLLLVGAPEDDFIEMLFTGAEYDSNGNVVKSYTNEPFSTYLELSDDKKRRTAVTGTSQEYKDPYFETMFYKTYLGTYDVDNNGNKNPLGRDKLQIPCINMKHFYAEFMSDMAVYQYFNTVKAAVVIAKYYEGAYINGTILFNGQPVNNSRVVVQKNLTYSVDPDYPIDIIPIEHDKDDIIIEQNPEGKFNVIAGAGAIIQVRRVLGQGSFPLINITFNDSNDKNYAPITEEDAMRKSDNYERNLTINIEPANIEGYVYEDVNDDGVYNTSDGDKPMPDLSVYIYEITNFKEDNQIELGSPIELTTDENGYYSKTNLIPGFYRIGVSNTDGYNLALEDLALYSGNRTFNIATPKPANINGMVYYDNDLDGKYDSGEELSGATVLLELRGEEIASAVTTDDGLYSFDSLTPGKINNYDINAYTLTATKKPEYQYTETIYPEENKTTTINISIKLVPVTVSGQTTYDEQPVDGALIEFVKDNSVTRNTAEDSSATTDTNGQYSVSLQPGSYNVSITKYDGQALITTLLYQLEEGIKLVLSKGQGSATENYILDKKSVTVTGTAKYGTENIANLTITFEPADIRNGTLNSCTTTETGYTVKLTPGEDRNTYDLVTGVQEFNIDGINYTYSISNDTKQITVSKNEITSGQVFNIELERHMKDEET
jgi:dolichyl-diphosphooligosaccharide--protein glycosyltransferase